MTAGKSSAVAAVASELGCAEPHTGADAPDPAQADLLRDLDAEMSLFADQPIAPPAKRGAGRPPGSPNRTTLQLQALLRARGYRDPAEFLASIVSADPVVLAAKLHLALSEGGALEVLKVQRQAAESLMPYFHTRMPQSVQLAPPEARPFVLIMEAPAVAEQAQADAGVMTLDLKANQGVGGEAPVPSHDAGSHDAG